MVFGISIPTFTIIHTLISLIAIATGFIVVAGLFGSKRLPAWTAVFWLTTVLTSVTGFMFPINGFTPALGTGVVATLVFIPGLIALYVKNLAGSWRWIYAVSAVVSLYLNVFVLIVQVFQKIKLINPLAPQLGPPFAEPQNTQFVVAQAVALIAGVVAGFLAARRFRPL